MYLEVPFLCTSDNRLERFPFERDDVDPGPFRAIITWPNKDLVAVLYHPSEAESGDRSFKKAHRDGSSSPLITDG